MPQQAMVREFASEAEAALAAATLRAHGIHADTAPAAFGLGWNTTMAGPTTVVVPAHEIDRARALLDKLIK